MSKRAASFRVRKSGARGKWRERKTFRTRHLFRSRNSLHKLNDLNWRVFHWVLPKNGRCLVLVQKAAEKTNMTIIARHLEAALRNGAILMSFSFICAKKMRGTFCRCFLESVYSTPSLFTRHQLSLPGEYFDYFDDCLQGLFFRFRNVYLRSFLACSFVWLTNSLD